MGLAGVQVGGGVRLFFGVIPQQLLYPRRNVGQTNSGASTADLPGERRLQPLPWKPSAVRVPTSCSRLKKVKTQGVEADTAGCVSRETQHRSSVPVPWLSLIRSAAPGPSAAICFT